MEVYVCILLHHSLSAWLGFQYYVILSYLYGVCSPAVYNAPVVLTNAVYEAPQEAPQEARPVEPEAKNSEALIPAATLTIPNPYSKERKWPSHKLP